MFTHPFRVIARPAHPRASYNAPALVARTFQPMRW